MRERVDVAARARAEDLDELGLAELRELPDGPSFAACSLRAVFGPMPQSCSTRSGCRNARSSLGATTSSPSGLAARLAIFATIFVRATPTVIGRLVSRADLRPQPLAELARLALRARRGR